MVNQKQYLVVFGVPSIKKFVFGTDRLKEIRGASALLDDLNINQTRQWLKGEFKIHDDDIVFLGGGAGQFIVSGDENSIADSIGRLEKLYSDKSEQGLRLLWGMAEYTEGNYGEARKEAENRSEAKRDETPFLPATRLHTGYVRECDSCSEMAAVVMTMEDESESLCRVCTIKRNFERGLKKGIVENDSWTDFTKFLKSKGKRVDRPQTFVDIGELCAAKKDFTALVYADGNSMGKLIGEIPDKEQFRFFSKIVDQAIKDACHEALYETFFNGFDAKDEGTFPADILLLGGDDLVVYMTAEAAFPFSIAVAEKFSRITEEIFKTSEYPFFRDKMDNQGMTISLGIAYGKSNTPFSIMMSQAGELLKQAKKSGSRDSRTTKYYSPSYIDYHLATAFNRLDVKGCRDDFLELPGTRKIRLYRKPYSCEDARALLGFAVKIKNSGIPGTRLKRFGYAPTLGRVNGSLECLKLYTRARQGPQRVSIMEALEYFGCARQMPWNDESDQYISTVLSDLVEIAEFCGKGYPEFEEGSYASSY